jgi:hypothetical protein
LEQLFLAAVQGFLVHELTLFEFNALHQKIPFIILLL